MFFLKSKDTSEKNSLSRFGIFYVEATMLASHSHIGMVEGSWPEPYADEFLKLFAAGLLIA